MRQLRIDSTVERYLTRVKGEHLGELAQYLIALRIDFSPALRRKLVEQKQVSYVVGCQLSPEVEDIVRAVDFLMNKDGNETEAIKMLIHSDLNQVVNLLKNSSDALSIFE